MAYLRIWTRRQFRGHIPLHRQPDEADNQRFYLYLAMQLHRSVFEPIYWQDVVSDFAFNSMDHTYEYIVWAGSERG